MKAFTRQRSSRMGALLLLAAILITGAPFAGGAPAGEKAQKLEDVSYKAPAGWKESELNAKSRLFLAPDSAESRQAILLLMLGPAFEGEFRPRFEQAIKAANQNREIVKA